MALSLAASLEGKWAKSKSHLGQRGRSLSLPCHAWLRAGNCAGLQRQTSLIPCSLKPHLNSWGRRGRHREARRCVQPPTTTTFNPVLCNPSCRGAHSCHPQSAPQEVLPGPRGVNSQADTCYQSAEALLQMVSVCPIGPLTREENHLIIFISFGLFTLHHCNTSEQMPGNSEAASRSGGCSELSRLVCVRLLSFL